MSRRRSAGPVDCKAMYHPTRRRAAQPAGSSAFDRPEAEAGAGAGRTAFACLVCLRASDPVRARHVAIAKSAVAASPARRPGRGLKPVIWSGARALSRPLKAQHPGEWRTRSDAIRQTWWRASVPDPELPRRAEARRPDSRSSDRPARERAEHPRRFEATRVANEPSLPI